jgi:outer membrane putative beta-barrel porin/alpha-amylase
VRRTFALLALAVPALSQDIAQPLTVADWARLLPDGAWSLSLRADLTDSSGLRTSRTDVSNADLFAAGYSTTTDEFTSRVVSLRLARGLDGCTLYLALPLVDLERSGRDDLGADFEQSARSIGDLELGVTKIWRESEDQQVVWSFAAKLPTGSVDEEDGGERLPYPLQPGSGTVDLFPAAAMTRHRDGWDWGLAGRARVRLGRNSEDWARSNSLVLDAWAGRPLGEDLSGRVGLRNTSWGDLYGADPALDPALDPLADDARQGGTRTDLVAGMEWQVKDLALGLELGMPLDEWLDGPQASTDFTLAFGLRLGW